MPNFQAWLGTTAGVKSNRAEDAWQRIQQKPSSIVIIRTANASSTDTLDEQTVRIEYDSDASETGSTGSTATTTPGAGRSSIRELTVFGVKDHPVQPDTDIRRGDQFKHNNGVYTVDNVIDSFGEIQAKARRTS